MDALTDYPFGSRLSNHSNYNHNEWSCSFLVIMTFIPSVSIIPIILIIQLTTTKSNVAFFLWLGSLFQVFQFSQSLQLFRSFQLKSQWVMILSSSDYHLYSHAQHSISGLFEWHDMTDDNCKYLMMFCWQYKDIQMGLSKTLKPIFSERILSIYCFSLSSLWSLPWSYSLNIKLPKRVFFVENCNSQIHKV